MSYFDEWKKNRANVSLNTTKNQTSYFDEWKKRRLGQTTENEEKPEEDTYDYDAGAARIERLKYYSDKAKEYNSILSGVAGNPSEQGAKNKAAFDLQSLYAEYDKEFGAKKPTTIKGETSSSPFANNMTANTAFVNNAPKVDFDKLLAEAEQKHKKASDSHLYDSIVADPNYSAFTEKVKNAPYIEPNLFQMVKDQRQNKFDRVKWAEQQKSDWGYDAKGITIYNNGDEANVLPILMTNEEKTLYHWYFYELEDYDRAEEYYQSIKGELEDRAHKLAQENVYKQSKENPGFSSVQSIVRSVYGTPTEAIMNAGEAVWEYLTGKGDGNIDRNRTADLVTTARTGVSEDMSPVGRFLYNTAMSGADSLLSGLSFGNAGGVALALSAGSSTYNEALDKGMDANKAATYGLMSAVFEGVFESISLGRLLKEVPVDTWVDVVKNLAISMGVNASEEMATEIANLTYDSIANGEFSQFAELREQGLGFWDIMGKFGLQTLEAGASGALMGFGFGGIQSGASAVNVVRDTVNTGKGIKNKGLTDAYIESGLQFEGTEAYNAAIKAQKKATNYRVGRLSQTLTKSALQTSFTEATGSKETATNLTDIIMGREVSKSAISDILGNEKALNALNETLGTSIKKDTDTKTFRKEVAEAVVRQTDDVIDSLGKLGDSVKELVRGEIISDKEIDAVLKNKKAREVLSLRTGVEITKDSTVQEVKQALAEANNDYSRAKQAVLFASTLNMGVNGTKAVARLVANSSGGVASTVLAFNAVYQTGKQGKAISEARNPYLSELTMAQRLAAYEYGVMDGLTSKAINEKTAAEAEISRESEVPEGAIVTKGGETVVPVKENTKEQTRIIDMGKKLGVEVAFGKITKKGKNIDGLFDGKVLYINPKTTSGSGAYVLFKHEFTHFLEKSTKYINFAKAVTESKAFSEWLKKKGFKNSTEYYAQIIADYKQIGKNLEMGGAQKEAVANFCAEMLYAKDDSMQRFVDTLSADHKRTFGELIRDFIEWIKKKLGKVDEIAMLEKKYAELFKDAKKVEAKGVTEKNEVSYSLNVREVNGRSHIVNPYTISKEDVLDYLEMSLRRRLEDNTYFPVSSYTPDTLIYTLQAAGININDKPMAMQAKKAKQSQSKGTPYKKDGILVRHHEMSAEEIIETIDKMSNPNAIIQETNQTRKRKIDGKYTIEPAADKFTVFVTLDSGKECVAVIEFDSEMAKNDIVYDGHGEEYHTTVTVFEPDVVRNGLPFDYVEYLLLNTNNRELDIKRESPKSDAAYGEKFATANEKGLSNSSIPQNSDLSTGSSKKTSETDDTQTSYTPSERDTEYLDAVNRGDMETAQRMVDEAAKEAGYTVEAYHGTKSDFTKFSKEKFGANFGNWSLFGAGFYFAPTKRMAEYWGDLSKENADAKVMRVFLRASKMLQADEPLTNDKAINLIKEKAPSFDKGDIAWTLDRVSRFVTFMVNKGYDANMVREFFMSMGYDGVDYSNLSAGKYRQYVVFDPEQIKSADPVTYDDDGNVIPLSQRFKSENDDIRYSYAPDKEATSTREILANMMDTVAESEREKNLLAKYKGYLERIDNNKAEIARLKEERKAASKAKKNVFTSKIQALEKDISDTERRLSNLEAMDTIKRLVEKERQAMADEAHLAGQMAQGRRDAKILRTANERLEAQKAEAREQQKQSVIDIATAREEGVLAGQMAQGRKDSEKLHRAIQLTKQRFRKKEQRAYDKRHTLETKQKIAKTVKKLDTLLRKGTKDKHVHFGLQDAVASALEIIDINAEKTISYNKAITDLQRKLDDAIAREDETDIEAYTAALEKKKKNFFNFEERLEKMRKAYADIRDGKAEDIPPYYREEAKVIESIIEETIGRIGGVLYEDMNLEQLEQVYKMYKVILTTVQNANKVLKGEKLADLVEDAGKIEHDLGDIKKLKEERWIGAEGAREYIWNELTPYYAFNRIGSETLMEYYWDLVRGQDTYARDVTEAKNFAQAIRKKYGYKNWDLDKTYTIKDKNGKDFSLSLKHMMSIYAYSKREQAKDHMEQGGFFFNDKETFRKDKKGLLHFIRSNETGYKVDEGVMTAILELMSEIDENTIAYVDEMQEYLTKMGEKGNEVTRKMWGIDIFKEKFYFPLKSKEDFIYQANTPAETSSLKNDGMTKETKPHASNPIVLEAFDSVWDQHVEKMSKYHAFVIPIDNLNKVINYGTWADGDSKSITTMIRERYSSAAVDYLNTFIKDLNGAKAPRRMGWTFVTNLVTKFKKTAVAASMSVVVQQPTAILRSLSEIDAKYFAKLPKAMGLNAKWELIQKHAPVAIIKDIGGYDAGGGRSVIDWMSDDTKTGLDKAMSKIDNLTMYGAALGDRLGWGAIWTAVENEIADTTSLERGSEEFYEAVGKRFTEVIVKTQVYDSTLSRSGFMRGKDGLIKMAMAFKGEPTLSINMIMDAILQATRGKISKKHAARTIAAVYTSVIAATLAKSLVYALRDDDEDESYLEKYAQAVGGNIISDTVPLTMLPIFSDVWSVLEGYTLERTDMSLIVDLYNAFTSLDSENKTTYRKIEDLAGAMGGLVGIPAKNILRSFREGYNVFENIFDGVDFGDVGKAFAEGVTGNEATKSESLYNAVMNKDTARINIYRDDYKDESTYTSALKRSLRENDPRVVKSVERALLGDYTLYNNSKRVISSTSKYGVKLVNEAFADEREYVLNKLDEARKARKNGDLKEYNKIIDQLVARGYSKAFILKKLK
jgi:hypothetical protein